MTAPYRYEYKIGTTFGGMTNLEGLNTPVPPPFATFRPYQSVINLGDGTTRGLGFPSVTWAWAFLSNAQRDVLRAFCTGSSASVYIHTKKNDSNDAYDDYLGVMLWPEEEQSENHHKMDFTLTFVSLVHVTS